MKLDKLLKQKRKLELKLREVDNKIIREQKRLIDKKRENRAKVIRFAQTGEI